MGYLSGAVVEAQFKWKMQSLWQAGSVNQQVFVRYTERVKEMTGGRLEIEPLAVGTVVAYNETVDAVGAGILDGVHGGGGYSAGKEVGFSLITDLNNDGHADILIGNNGQNAVLLGDGRKGHIHQECRRRRVCDVDGGRHGRASQLTIIFRRHRPGAGLDECPNLVGCATLRRAWLMSLAALHGLAEDA